MTGLPEPGAHWLRLKPGISGVRFRREAGIDAATITVFRGGEELRYYGNHQTSGSYTWLEVYQGVRRGFVAWNPAWFDLEARGDAIWEPGALIDPRRYIGLGANVTGRSAGHTLRVVKGAESGGEFVQVQQHGEYVAHPKGTNAETFEMKADGVYRLADSSDPGRPQSPDGAIYNLNNGDGAKWLPNPMRVGQRHEFRYDLRYFSKPDGRQIEFHPGEVQYVALAGHYETWRVADFFDGDTDIVLRNVIHIVVTRPDGALQDEMYYSADPKARGLVGWRNGAGWFSHIDGFASGGNNHQRAYTMYPVAGIVVMPELAIVDGQPAEPPVVVDPPDEPEPPEAPGDEDGRRLVWERFAFDGLPWWSHHEDDRTMVLPAGFEARWMPFAIEGVDSPMPYIFNREGEGYYQFKFNWVTGLLYVDIDQALEWDGPGIYTVLLNISRHGDMQRPELVQWGVCFDMADGREVVIPEWFNAADHSGQVFIPVEIDDPAQIERVALLFFVPEASVSGGEIRVYSFAMWPALAGDADLYPPDYEMETVGPVQPVEPEPPDEPEPPAPGDGVAVKLREIAELLHGLADEL